MEPQTQESLVEQQTLGPHSTEAGLAASLAEMGSAASLAARGPLELQPRRDAQGPQAEQLTWWTQVEQHRTGEFLFQLSSHFLYYP